MRDSFKVDVGALPPKHRGGFFLTIMTPQISENWTKPRIG